LWLVVLVSVVLILSPRSEQHYLRTPGRHARKERPAAPWPGREHAWPADSGSASWN
jgi:hypothetical protein